ncbi:MAG: Bug family tripartite tricarboxylate transporter substrate binding protein [Burkholderiaceae bacterium]
MDRRSFLMGASLLAAGMRESFAQGFPSQPIRLVVGFTPGGATDIIARFLADALRPKLGSVIVENRPGATGMIAASYVARRPPDGYTLLFGSNGGMAIAAPNQEPPPFDSEKDFEPVAMTGAYDALLVANIDFPAKSIPELVKLLKADPDKYQYAVSGLGGPIHLAGALFFREVGVKPTVVPYKGGGPALVDVQGGRVPLMMTSLGTIGNAIAEGKVRLLASSGSRRMAQFPNTPTFAEAGYPGAVATFWNGVFAPAGTSPQVINKIADAIRETFADPAFREKWEKTGGDAVTSTPAELRRELASEIKKWKPVVTELGIRPS